LQKTCQLIITGNAHVGLNKKYPEELDFDGGYGVS